MRSSGQVSTCAVLRLNGPMNRAYVMVIALACSGCTYAPSIALFGAFFPAWMLCALMGIVLAVVVRSVVAAIPLRRDVMLPAAIYPLLAVLSGAGMWLLFFRG